MKTHASSKAREKERFLYVPAWKRGPCFDISIFLFLEELHSTEFLYDRQGYG